MCQTNRHVECKLFAIIDWHSAVSSHPFFLSLPTVWTLSQHRILSGPRLAWHLWLEPGKIWARCGNSVRGRRKHIYDLKVLKSSSAKTNGTMRSCGRGKGSARSSRSTQPCPATQAKCPLLIITMAALNLVRGQRWLPTVGPAETILSPHADFWSQLLKSLSPKMSGCPSAHCKICKQDSSIYLPNSSMVCWSCLVFLCEKTLSMIFKQIL